MSPKLRPVRPLVVLRAGSIPFELHLRQNLRAQGVRLLGREE